MRRIQFSVRYCLIATVILACLFAVVGSRYREALCQASIAERLAESGATIEYDDAIFPSVTGVFMVGRESIDEDLQLIGRLPDIKDLTLQFGEFSNDSLHHLCGLEKLENVDLKWTTITDEGLTHLAQIPSIRSLVLNKSYPPAAAPNVHEHQITDRGLVEISKLRNLENLVIWGAHISDDGLASIAACEQLKVLWLCDTRIDGGGLVNFERLTQLQELDLCGTDVTAESLQHLRSLTHLRSLRVARTNVAASEALAFQASRDSSFSIGY